MKDFTKWAAMWDAYAESNPGDPTPGTPAAICSNIGLIMAIGGLIGAFIRLASESDKLVTTSVASSLAALLGVALLLASSFLPSHNDVHISEPPTLSEQIEGAWNLNELDDCENMGHGLMDSPKLPKSSLEDGDWKCVAYADDSKTWELPPCYGSHKLQTDLTGYDLLIRLGVIDNPYGHGGDNGENAL